ncbi:MAG: Glu/Leu/Phe/Val dehydrogenase [Patescibacteria group bacterium]
MKKAKNKIVHKDGFMIDIASDPYGPEYVVKVSDRKLGMEGFLVVHNTALGPGKGGIRMMPDVSEEEVYRLAETMTWKNALAGIPFGGAKAGIRWPGGPDKLKKQFIESFARAIRPFLIKKYIAGPDVNTGEREMQWFAEAVGKWQVVTGKPARYCLVTASGEKCGIPHEIGSTGFGVAHAARVAAEAMGIDMKGARVSIHGFGNVGTFAYRHLTAMGAQVVAIADQYGAVYAENGFDAKIVERMIAKRTSIIEHRGPGTRVIAAEDFWSVPVEIMVPASVTDVINDGNKGKIKTRLIVEGGNIVMREPIERELFKRGIMIVPDFVANAGGVISSYAEYRGMTTEKMFKLVEQKIVEATKAVVSESLRTKKYPREVALRIARERVEAATKKRAATFC